MWGAGRHQGARGQRCDFQVRRWRALACAHAFPLPSPSLPRRWDGFLSMHAWHSTRRVLLAAQSVSRGAQRVEGPCGRCCRTCTLTLCSSLSAPWPPAGALRRGGAVEGRGTREAIGGAAGGAGAARRERGILWRGGHRHVRRDAFHQRLFEGIAWPAARSRAELRGHQAVDKGTLGKPIGHQHASGVRMSEQIRWRAHPRKCGKTGAP